MHNKIININVTIRDGEDHILLININEFRRKCETEKM